MIRRWMVMVGVAASLVACGGGDDDEAGGGGGGGGGIGSRIHRYEQLATATTGTDFQAQLTARGAAGYRYVGVTGYAGASRSLFVNDASVAYTYEVLGDPGTYASFVNQVTTQGARGFRLTSFDARGFVYRKVTNSTETFTYEAEPGTAPAGLPSGTFVAQVNARGNNGFRLNDVVSLYGGAAVNLWEKSSVAGPKYAVRVEDIAATEAAQLTRFDTHGQAGYRLRGIRAFSDGNLWVFERDTQQTTATFRYFIDPAVASAADLVTQANTQGASGRGFDGQVNLQAGARDVYFLATNCTGVLCDVRGPSGY